MLISATPGDVLRAINRAKAGQSFIGGLIQGASVANFSHVQFLNPAASGVTAILRRAGAAMNSVAAVVSLRRHDVALTTLSAARANKLVGGSPPACELRSQVNASILGSQISRMRVPVIMPFEFITHEPMILGAGEGVLVVIETTDDECLVHFEWLEES